MAINDEIAAGVKPVQFENPLNNMVKFANIQNDMSNMALHRQKTVESQRLQAEDINFKDAMARIADPYSPEGKNQVRQAYYNHGRGDKYEAMQTSEAGVRKANADVEAKRQATSSQALRNITYNPSPENIIAHNQDYQLNPDNSPEDKASSQRTANMLVAMPIEQRREWLASQGASASDLKKHISNVNAGGSTITTATDPYSGKTTQVGEVAHTLTPEQNLNAVPGQANLVERYNQTTAEVKSLFTKANDPANAGQAEQLIADALALSRSNELRGETIKDMQAQTAQGKHAKAEFLQLNDRLEQLREAGQENSPEGKALQARIAKETNIPQADESVVVRTTTDNDGTVHMYNRFGVELKSQKNAGKTAPDSLAGPEKRMPAHIIEIVAKNKASISNIDNAVKQVILYPSGFGVQAYLSDAILQRTDPEGVTARASVANIGSLKIHDRSGAAVTVGETPRLRPFIPTVSDAPDTVIKKLKELRREALKIANEYEKSLSEQGYRTGSPAEAGATRTGATVSNWN